MLEAPEKDEPGIGATTKQPMQHTLAGEVTVSGRGLLLGEEATATILPAAPNHGIVFERIDVAPPVQIPALVPYIARRARRTTLALENTSIETVEHCMSAFAGLGVDNALIRLDGPELPCGDGSPAPFVDPIIKIGLIEQDSPRRVFRITEPIVVEADGAMLTALPTREDELRVIFDLDYGHNSHRIKRQIQTYASSNGDYRNELARARTYSLKEEAQALWDRGMCRHLSPRDVLVIDDDGPIDNQYRYDDEPVRHKIVDLLGDLYLVGCEVHGQVVAYKSGHELNRQLCIKIVEQMEAAHRQEILLHGRKLDIRAIQRLMPHRYPMLLVDRVVEMDGDRKAIGVKNVTINEPFFSGHYPGTPIMPGVLIVEAMAQLGGLLMSQKLEHTGKIAVLLSLDKVKLRHPVTPGDQLILEAEAVRAKPRSATVKCQAFVGTKVAAQALIKFMMVDAEHD